MKKVNLLEFTYKIYKYFSIKFISGTYVNQPNDQDFSPICLAAKNYDYQTVEYLAMNGATIQISKPGGKGAFTLDEYRDEFRQRRRKFSSS